MRVLLMGQDTIDWPRMLDEITGNIRNKYSLLLAGRLGVPYHQRISASAHQRISASAHQRISAP